MGPMPFPPSEKEPAQPGDLTAQQVALLGFKGWPKEIAPPTLLTLGKLLQAETGAPLGGHNLNF